MLKRLLVYLKEFKRDAILSPVLIIIEAVCELFLPLLMAHIIDIGINESAGLNYILKQGMIMLLLSVISMTSAVKAAKYAANASQGFGRNLRTALFGQIQQFSFADIDRFSSASLITRTTNDVATLQNAVAMGLRIFVRAPLQLISALLMCLILNARLTIILAIVFPIMVTIAFFLMKMCRRLFTIFQEKIDGLNDAVQENLVAIRVVKAFVRTDFENKKFAKANDELRDAGLNAVMKIVMMSPILMILLNGAIISVYWFGGKQVAAGGMLIGNLYSFYSYIAQVIFSVLMVAICLIQLTRASACAKRIMEVLDAVPDIRDPEKPVKKEKDSDYGKVEFKNVSFRYQAGSGDDVLKDINLTIEPGQFVAVVGETGVGKSTLVNLIPRFYDASSGDVFVSGVNVKDYAVEDLREQIGMVLQKNVLFTGTIRENLLWGDPDATEEDMIQAAKNAQAHEFIMQRENGYDTMIDQGGVNVSGGQKQRLCIARAMLRHPSILILDDSTSAVDAATEAEIRKSFHDNLKGTTVIIIAQRISSVRYADKIVVLDDDHIEAQGTHEELLASCKIYQEIYQSQQEGVISNG